MEEDLPFLVMSYAPGGSLRQLHPAGTVVSPDAPPTRQARLLFEDLSARVATLTRQLRTIIDTDGATFNARVREANVPAIIPPATGNRRE